MQAYSNPARESDPHALPDLEVFLLGDGSVQGIGMAERGWYYWHCFPGCLPDGEATGPFPTAEDAIKAAQAECAPGWDDDIGGSHIDPTDL